MWDGVTWTQKTPATSPPARELHAMAYDKLHQQVVLFGGLDTLDYRSDTWVWDGTNWTQKTPATVPPKQAFLCMAYDEARQRVVMACGGSFGTFIANDTWVWDGSNWTHETSVANPPAGAESQIGYDQTRQQTVRLTYAFDSVARLYRSQTWLWDGTSWTQATPATSPAPRNVLAPLQFMTASQQTLLFGGTLTNTSAYVADNWVWDGVTWSQLNPTTSPSPRVGYGLAYDAVNQQVVLFGGEAGDGTHLSDTWLLADTGSSIAVTVNVPAGVQFTFNGTAYTGSQTINIAPGSYTLATVSPQAIAAGTQAVFASWSDAGTQTHSVTVGSSAVSITGVFTTQYFLGTTVSPFNGGTITPSGTGGSTGPYFDAGSTVNVTEQAAANFTFSGWAGACAGTAIPCVVTVNAPASVVANFLPPTYQVTINVPAGVLFSVGGPPYTGPQTLSLAPNTYALVLATPQSTGVGTQAVFVSWSDGGAASHSFVVSNTALTITGTFKTQYQFTSAVSPAGSGSVLPATSFYDTGTPVTVTESPNPSWAFAGYSGDCSGLGPCSVTMNAPHSVTAQFAGVTVNVPAGIQFTLNGTTYTGSQNIGLAPGSYSLTMAAAQPNGTGTQALFVSWSDGGLPSHSITVGAARLTITATFKTQYLLTTSANPPSGGSVTQTGPGSAGPYYDPGTVVTVIAFTSGGSTFTSWVGACSGTSPICFVTMNSPLSATANFAVPKFLVTINVPPGIQYSLSGFPLTGSASFSLPAGSYQLALASPQSTGAGAQAVFLSWSDGGAQSHNVIVTNGAVTVNGSFKSQYLLTTTAVPASEGTVTQFGPVGPFYDAGTVVLVSNTPAPGYQFQFWSGACTGFSPACAVTMNAPVSVVANFDQPQTWVQFFPTANPTPREASALAYDTQQHQSLLFGGGPTGFDTWTFDGTNWTQQSPATVPELMNPGAAGRSGNALAYDAGNAQVVLFGGQLYFVPLVSIPMDLADTWVWDSTSNWTRKSPPTSPPARDSHAMAYDAARHQVVLFGGTALGGIGPDVYFSDTWVWDGNNWTQKFPIHVPPARQNHSMAYDAERQVVVLFGGLQPGGYFDDTWVWNGVDWLLQAPLTRPPARALAGMTFDSAHQQTLLFGGDTGDNGLFSDTWAWDGANWIQRTPVSSPPARALPAMSYDALLQRPLVFGGGTNSGVANDLWEWMVPSVSLVPLAPSVVNDGAGNYVVTVTLKNAGNVPVTFLFALSAKMGNIAATGFVGSTFVGNIAPGATGSFSAKFPIASIPGKTSSISFQGSYSAAGVTGAQWNANIRQVNLP